LLSSNTDEVVREIRNRYPTQKIQIYPDPAGNQRKTSASGATDISILRNAGFTVKVPNSHNPVRDGINAVNSKLCSATGQRTFFVDPKCKKTIESLEKHSYKEGSSIPDKDSGFDHFSDSIRYYIDYDFPVRRTVEPQIPKRWGHALA
jgi:phage terminase large subunit